MTQTEKQSVSILLTAGLLAVVLIHAIALSTAQRAIPRIENAIFGESLTDNYPRGGINFDAQRMSDRPINALPINQSARDEIKRQTSGTPFSGVMNGGVTYINGVPCDTCPQPRQPQPQPQPTPNATTAKPVSKPVAPKYSLSLFVIAGDRTSQQLVDWFANDARLKKLASGCNYQIYTRDNPLYKARFASTIPPDSFPAVLFQDLNGGRVHVANGTSVSTSASQLGDDLEAAYRLQKQIVTTLPNGPSPIQSTGPSNSGSNCPDGNCPEPERAPFWRRPGGNDNDGGGLFPNLQPSTDPMQGILRMIFRPGETIFQIIVVLAVVTIVYFVKRGRW